MRVLLQSLLIFYSSALALAQLKIPVTKKILHQNISLVHPAPATTIYSNPNQHQSNIYDELFNERPALSQFYYNLNHTLTNLNNVSISLLSKTFLD